MSCNLLANDLLLKEMHMADEVKVEIPFDELLSHRWFHLKTYLEQFEEKATASGAKEGSGDTVVVTLKLKQADANPNVF